MKVLVIGEDGHAHALAWKLFNSPLAHEVICAPGNGGTSQLVPSVDLDLQASTIAHWAFEEGADIIVPASSAPLHAGLVDEVVSIHIGVFGSPQRSARIDRSRCAAKEFLLRHNIPTAEGKTFTSLSTAEKYLASRSLPVVIKADNPAIATSVYHDRYTALEALRRMHADYPIESRSDGIVIESYLAGTSISCSAFVDGHTALPLLPTRSYEHIDQTPNSLRAPGMGASTSTSPYTLKLTEYIHQHILQPIVAAFQSDNLPYWGMLGLDCIVTDRGPRAVALRCHMRDMEAQVVLPLMEHDMLPIVQATIARRLDSVPPLRWRTGASVGVALVAQGYPYHFPIGSRIEGLTSLDAGVLTFHDQTANPLGMTYKPARQRGLDAFSKLLRGSDDSGIGITTTGGHVLTVVALGATLQEARRLALDNAARIEFAGRYYRDDIGRDGFQ